MKVLVFSDTHRHINECLNVISTTPDVGAVIHAGDMVSDAEDLACAFDNITFYYVSGNNDIFSDAPCEKLVTICGHKIFIAHGHTLGVRQGEIELAHRANELGAQMAVFGHTHECCDKYVCGVHVINPGSMGYYPKSYAQLDIDDTQIRAQIVRYK